MLSWRNAPAVRMNMYTRHEIPLSEHMAWWAKAQNNDCQKYFMYEFRGISSGIVGFSEIDKVNNNACWAFYAAPEAPKGTGSRIEYLALDYAFTKLKVHKLYCEVLAFNNPVIKLHRKFGFKEEGVFREQHIIDEGYVDIYRLGILAEEWMANMEQMREKISSFL